MHSRPLKDLVRSLHRLAGAGAMEGRSDAELLRQFVASGDEAAFTLLSRRHGWLIQAVCRQVLARAEDVEDAVQATLLVLARKAASIRKGQAVASWLHGTAFRTAMSLRKSAGRQRKRQPRAVQRSPEQPQEVAALRELQAILQEEVARLPEKMRSVFVLCCLAGKSRAEAAGELGWKEGTVSGQLARARAELHRRLTRRGVELTAALTAAALTMAPGAPLSAAMVRQVLTAVAGQQTALSGKVLALAERVMFSMLVAKLKLGAAMVLGLMVLVGVAGWQAKFAGNPAPAPPSVEEKAETKPAPLPIHSKPLGGLDRFGDPLPEGALMRFGTSRFRHGNGTSLTFAGDGKALISCGADGTIRFWDLASGRLVRQQQFISGPYIQWALLSPDGKLMAFQHFDANDVVHVWDVVKNQLRYKFPMRDHWNHQAIFSPDSKTLVTANQSMAQDADRGKLHAWDVATGKGRVLGVHRGGHLAFTADGKTLMTMRGLNDPGIRFWDVVAGGEKSRLKIPEAAGAALSPDGRTIVLWSHHNPDRDLGLKFLDSDTGNPKKTWIAPDRKKVHGATFTPDGKNVLVCIEDELLLWDPIKGQKVCVLRGRAYSSPAFSPDGKSVAAFDSSSPYSGVGTNMRVWNLASGEIHPANSADLGHQTEVRGVAMAPDGRTIATCGTDLRVRLWQADTGRLLRTFPVEDRLCHSLAFSPDSKHIFVGGDSSIIRYEAATGRQVARFQMADRLKAGRYLNLMHLTQDGRTLLALSNKATGQLKWQHMLHSWDSSTAKAVDLEISEEEAWTGYSRFSPDGRLLVVPGGSICEVSSGKQLFRLAAKDKILNTPVAISPNGSLVAAGVWQEIKRPNVFGREMIAIQVWEMATLLPVIRIETGELAHVAFTPDGRSLITAGPDALKLWDLANGRVIAQRLAPARIRGSYGPSFASCLAVAADGRTLATGHADTTALLWTLAAPPRPAHSLPAAELEKCWSELASADAGRAFSAFVRLADAPKQAVALLQERLQPAQSPPPETLRKLIAELDDPQFTRREATRKQLADLADLAAPALEKALRNQRSLEARRRIEALLKEAWLVRNPETRRHLRALRVLACIGGSAARGVLEKLAAGAAEARVTQEANRIVSRLKQTSPGSN